jgi:hypothetical protein
MLSPPGAAVNRDRIFLPVACGLALHALLAFGPHELIPAPLRLPLAFVVLVMLPGYAFVALSAAPPGGWWLAPGWALGFGVAWNGALVLLTRALGQPFTVLAALTVPANAALWMLALAHPRRFPLSGAPRTLPVAAPGSVAASRWALIAVLAAAGVAALNAAQLGTPITYHSDSPDHVGTIRRMLETGDAFPSNAFFKDAGRAGVDPRKGLWHPQVAVIARLAGTDPYDAWRALSALIAPLFALNAAALGFLIGGPLGAAVAAWALVVTYGGTLARGFLREAVFATKLADQLALAATVAVLSDVARAWRADSGPPPAGAGPDERPAVPPPFRGTRRAALGLALGAVVTHVFAAIQFAIVFGALGLGLLIRDRGVSRPLRRLVAAVVPMGLACLPYLLWRARSSYGPANIIHTEPQGLLTLWDGARIVNWGVLWDWLAGLWVLFPLAWWALWRYGRSNPAVLYLLTTSVAVALVIFDPPLVQVLEPRLGYLLARMIWMVPLAGLLAWLLPGLVRRARRERGRSRWNAVAGLALTGLLLLPLVSDALRVLVRPGQFAAAEAEISPARWRRSLEELDAAFPSGQVVLSDPGTSYTVPAFTHHYVVTLLDQHSSPNDPHALTRILDARDALDPWGEWARTREVVDRYGVTLVVLNNRFSEIPPFDYWAPSPGWYAAARARLDAAPAAFERVADEGDFVVYQVHRDALAKLQGARPRPIVSSWDPAHAPVARRFGSDLWALQNFRLQPALASPGETVCGVAEWRALGDLPVGSYHVMVRFDRALPGGLTPPRAIGKPARKLLETLSRVRYRFRADHLPAAGAYGVDLWKPSEVVRDSFELEIPRDVADGAYQVRVKMLRTPHYGNLRLGDFFYDDDFLAGIEAGRLIVARDKRRLPPDAQAPRATGH